MKAGSAMGFARACSSGPLCRPRRFVIIRASLLCVLSLVACRLSPRALSLSSLGVLSLSSPLRVLSLCSLRLHPGLLAIFSVYYFARLVVRLRWSGPLSSPALFSVLARIVLSRIVLQYTISAPFGMPPLPSALDYIISFEHSVFS